jgi:hypothetical protein
MDKHNTTEPTTENIIELIDAAIADADEAKALAQEAIASLDERLTQLNQLEQLKEGAGADPPDWCLTKAQRELSTNKRSRP